MDGLITLDSTTVRRIGIMIPSQLAVNLGWAQHWKNGGIKSAFLHGIERAAEVFGKAYLRLAKGSPPKGMNDGSPSERLQECVQYPRCAAGVVRCRHQAFSRSRIPAFLRGLSVHGEVRGKRVRRGFF